MERPQTYAHVVVEAYKHAIANDIRVDAGTIVEVPVAAIRGAIQPWRFALPCPAVWFERRPSTDARGVWLDLIVGHYCGEEVTVDRTSRAPLVEIPDDVESVPVADLCRPVSGRMVNRRAATSNSGVDPANKRIKSLGRLRVKVAK